MRILFWSSAFLPQIGGIGVLAGQFLPAMRKRGYEYIVISSRDDQSLPPNTNFEGIPVHRFPFWQSIVDIDALTEVKRQVADLKRLFAPDLIHMNASGRDDFFHLTTTNAYPAPLLVTLHGEWVSQADPIMRCILHDADWVIGCSKSILDKGRQLAPEIIPRSSNIYNAVDAPSLSVEPLPIPPRVLCLGRLSKEKGFDLALTAFSSIVKRFPHVRLVVAGDGLERAALIKQAAEMDVGNAVDFVGWVAPENVPALINTATMVVMPSRLESLPVVALQAAHMARPVIGVSVGGLPEVVVDQRTGVLVEKENSQALANAMAFLLEHPETAAEMGHAARERAQEKFDWKRHVDAYDDLYRKLVESNRASASL